MTVQLEPFFQPIINVNNGLIAYNEVLARKKRRNSGHYISAGAIFSSTALPLAQIISLDNQVRHKAFAKYKEYTGNAQLSINISPDWFSKHAPYLKLKKHEIPTQSMLRDCDIDPARVVIELTEYAGDKDLIDYFVRAYRKMGAKIAIDDFGTGYSQIDRLVAIEPEIIKLDMSLFQRSLTSNYTMDLIEVIASFAKKRGSELIFEGIETPEQYQIAVQAGADLVQGYLFSQAQAEFFNDNHFEQDIVSLRYAAKTHQQSSRPAPALKAVPNPIPRIAERFQNSRYTSIR